MGRTIGINLGATNSVVSIMEDSEAKVIASEEGGAPRHNVRHVYGIPWR